MQRWRWTRTHARDRARRRRGTDHDSGRRSAGESGSAIEKEIASETETEIGSRGAMGREAAVERAAEIVGSITHMQVEIGRWQREWDFDCFRVSQLFDLDGMVARDSVLGME